MLLSFQSAIVLCAIAGVVFGDCPVLVVPDFMNVPTTTGYSGDPAFVVTCQAGYKFDTDVLNKTIQCTASDVWSTPLDRCIPKNCSGINLSGSYETGNIPLGYYGEQFNVTCKEGFAISVNHSEIGNKRVQNAVTLTCEDMPGSTTGQWNIGVIGTCQPIECPTPSNLEGAQKTFTDRLYQNRTVYNCISGHYIPITTTDPDNITVHVTPMYSLTAFCDGNAEWTPENSAVQLSRRLCKGEINYLGCLEEEDFIPTINFNINDTSAGNIIQQCIEECRVLGMPIAAVNGDMCFCGDLADVLFNTTDCSLPCPDYNETTKDSPVYCGGDFDRISAFSTIQSCYNDLDIHSMSSTVNITVGDSRITCIELCRGQGFKLAGYSQTGSCLCDDGFLQTFNNSQMLNTFSCDFNPDAQHVFHIAKYQLQAKTCEELFEKKIRTHSNYVLIYPMRTEFCYFKDGTVCDPEWVGYNGYCYYFLIPPSELLDFFSSRDLCKEQDADLVSIMNGQEYTFLRTTINDFEEIQAERDSEKQAVWWLGAVDSRNSSVFTWLDGNIFTHNIFAPGEPDYGQCASGSGVFEKNVASSCFEKHRVLCKKRSESTNCIHATSVNEFNNFSNTEMTLSMCTELCKGQQTTFLLVKGTMCICLDTIPAGSLNLTITNCSQTCPGDNFQFCGDTSDNIYTFRKVNDLPSAPSCKDLQLLGIGEGQFWINNQETICGMSDCPYSWVSINGGSCYKFNPGYSYGYQTVSMCARGDAYGVVIEDDQELQDIVSTVNTMSFYRGISEWTMGLTAVSTNNGSYRWANGRRTEGPFWSSYGSYYKPDMAFNPDNSTLWYGLPRYNYSNHICEKAPEYLGCWLTDVGPVIVDYDYMTIQLCVETCRVNENSFAFLGKTSCTCSSVAPTIPSNGRCNHTCSGQSNQVCGGPDNITSVYNVSAYEAYTSCSELFENGIFLSGTYLVNGNTTTCGFIDGSVACDDGWIALQDNCYRHFRPDAVKSRYQICDSQNATQTSLLHVAEFNDLMFLVQKIDFNGQTALPYTGITDGGYRMDVFQNQDGKLMSHELKTSGKLTVSDLHTGQQVISFKSATWIHGELDGGVVCKKDTSVIGCFDASTLPGNSYTLHRFGSIELTQCKQLCLEQEKNVTLMGNDSCICSDSAIINDLTSSTSGSCNIPCRVQTYQKCGDGSVVWAYETMEPDDPMATSCQDFYSSGIFYNATYLIRNSDDETTFRQQCGFSDDTECPPSWLGKDGQCYRFYVKIYKDGRNICFQNDSFLFNPVQRDMTNAFVDTFDSESNLTSSSAWFTGVFVVLYNVTYVASDGRLVRTDYSLQPQLPSRFVRYKNGTWIWTGSPFYVNFICQKHNDYLGCYQNDIGTGLPTFNSSINSLTTCLQWCQGRIYSYAAVSGTICQCMNDVASLVPRFGLCITPCSLLQTQSCGQPGQQLSTVVRITNETGMAKDCRELFSFGIIEPGIYKTRWDTTSSELYLTCFDNPHPLVMFSREESTIASRRSSVIKSKDFSMDNVFFSFPLASTWKPAVNLDSYIHIDLNDDFLVTGIVLTGRFTSYEQSHVTVYRLSYLDPHLNEWLNYTHHGQSNVSSGCDTTTIVPLCYNFLWHPFVSRSIKIFPLEWKNSVSVKIGLLGQPFSSFIHDEPYIGCCPDFENNSQDALVGSSDTQVCRDACRDMQMPFASPMADDTCLCGQDWASNGFLDTSLCPDGGRNGTGKNRAVHRTYEKRCQDPRPELQYGHVKHVLHPYHAGVDTYGTVLTYECDLGWEPVDPAASDQVTCNQENEWTNITLECQEIMCPVFSVENGVIDTNETELNFNSTITVYCHDKFWASNHERNMTVWCQLDKQWTAVPVCLRSLMRKLQRYHKKHNVFREDLDRMVTQTSARSVVDCIAKCQANLFCRFVNFFKHATTSESICRTFELEPMNSASLVSSGEWQYVVMSREID